MARNVKPKRKTTRTKLAAPVELKLKEGNGDYYGEAPAAPAAMSIADIDSVLKHAGQESFRWKKQAAESRLTEEVAKAIACALEGRDGQDTYSQDYKTPKRENVVTARRILHSLRVFSNGLDSIRRQYADYGI